MTALEKALNRATKSARRERKPFGRDRREQYRWTRRPAGERVEQIQTKERGREARRKRS